MTRVRSKSLYDNITLDPDKSKLKSYVSRLERNHFIFAKKPTESTNFQGTISTGNPVYSSEPVY